MKTLIIPDIHGKVKLLMDMLDEHGDAERIIQLGDLANCVWEDVGGDLECISLAKSFNIEVLVGNHEHPYFYGDSFYGFRNVPEVKDAIKTLNWKAATTVGDTLITHAGLHPSFSFGVDAETTAEYINEAWMTNPQSAIFNDCGRVRGGRADHGGILWRDFAESSKTTFPQVFGHSKGSEVRIDKNGNVCIDCEKPYVMEA